MKKFAIFAVMGVFSVFSSAAFAAQVVDLARPETLGQYGQVSQAPKANNGLIFMAHQDCVVINLPDVVKKIDHAGGSALSKADLPLEVLRGWEVTIWYNQEVTPKGFVQQDESPADHAPTSDDVTGPEITSLEGLEKAGQVRDRANSVWVDFAPTSDGRFGGELVAIREVGFNVTSTVMEFVSGDRYYVAEAAVLENKGGEATNTIASLKALSAPGQADVPKSGKYEDGNLWVVISLHGITSFYFEGDNVLKVDGGASLRSDPGKKVCYRADGGEIGTITVFLSREITTPKKGGGGSGGGGGCDAAGLGLPALALVALALKKRR